MNTIHPSLPSVNVHLCPACQRPHHWLADTCRDTDCPWTHHRDSYGLLVATMGECQCTLEAITSSLIAFIPCSGALAAVYAHVPAFWLMCNDGEGYRPTADEWLDIIGAVVDEQRSMGAGDVLEWHRSEWRDAIVQYAEERM